MSRSARCRAGRSRGPRLRRSSRSSSRSSIASGERSFVRAAASSSASGRPSSRRADLLDGGRVLVRQREARVGRLGALDEQRDRVVRAERLDRVLPLAGDSQRGSARDEERQPGRGLEHLGERSAPPRRAARSCRARRAPAARRGARRGSRRSGRSPLSRTPSASAIAGSRSAGSRIASSATKKAPSGKLARRARSPPRPRAASSRSRPGPVSVISRVSPRSARADLVELAVAPDERAHRHRHVAGAGAARRDSASSWRRIACSQLPQLGPGLEAELVEEHLARDAGTPRARPPGARRGRARA